MEQSTSPTTASNRLLWVDAVRGFAVFGIFIVNINSFGSPYFNNGSLYTPWNASLDQITVFIIDVFFQASFYTLFSVLFGFGVQIMIERLELKNIPLYPFLIRRFFLLICMGSIHAFLIWHGDILLSYGMVSLFLLMFLKVKNTSLLGWGVFLLGGCVWYITLQYYFLKEYLGQPNWERIEEALQNYQSNSIFTIWSYNLSEWVSKHEGINFILLILVLLSFFLFGMYIARKRWIHEPIKYRYTLIKLWIVFFLLFMGFKMLPYLFGNPLWFSYAQDNIGGLCSAIFYILTFTLIAQTKVGFKLIKPLAAVGRMALSNYILQTIFCFVLFSGVGFNLFGSVRPLVGVMIAIIVFLIQVLISNYWFKYFRFGPLEWIWRCLTYMKRQPFRKAG